MIEMSAMQIISFDGFGTVSDSQILPYTHLSSAYICFPLHNQIAFVSHVTE